MQPRQQQSPASRTLWRIDRSTSTVTFSVKKLLFITVTGRFKGLEGSIVFDPNDISASTVSATLAAAGVDTGNNKRDASLRSKQFLDVESFPTIEFQSFEVGRGTDRDTLVVKGALKIKGMSRNVVFRVTEIDRSKAPDGHEVIYYIAESELDRYDFGVKAWRGLIGKSLKVNIDVQANRER